MIRNERNYSLVYIIGKDLLYCCKLPLLLFILILMSAILVIITTYNTRKTTMEHEQLIIHSNALDAEWRNLILEKHSLGDHNRIEYIARDKLHMQYIDPLTEQIILYF